MITFTNLKWASFTHSTIYAALLASWAAGWQPGKTIFGFAHGIGWFVMCGLAFVGLRRRVIPLWLGVTVAVIGAVGPFAGSVGFVVQERRVDRGKV